LKISQKQQVLGYNEGKKKVRFLELDDVEVRNALARGRRKSKHAEVWAINAFDEWRICNGYSTDKSIANMSEAIDICPLVDLLFKLLYK
jgi:hypothetical protein